MLEQIRQVVPSVSGCYIYYNSSDQVIYVGKAKNLKNRMSSYFNRSHDLKTTKLVSNIVRFEYIITNTENEALILENNLIKKYNPKFNILLKDDKTYPYILVTDDLYPRLLKVRSNKQKGTYYGPFSSAHFVNEILVEINRMSQLRKCRVVPKEECIYYHLKQCYAPCILPVTPDQTKFELSQIKDLLKNDMKKLKSHFQKQMQHYAGTNDFESAMRYRDLLKMFDEKSAIQAVQFEDNVNVDIIGIYKDETTVSINIISVIDGKAERFRNNLVLYTQDYQEAIIGCLYKEFEFEVPGHIVCNDKVIQKAIIDYFNFTEYNSNQKQITELARMAYKNAADYYIKNIDKFTKLYVGEKNAGFEQLQELANSKLNSIEMVDISHLNGDAQVGVAVVYSYGQKDKSKYRKYKISKENIKDEYGSMREVLYRRLKRMVENNMGFADLLILDGGKGQVNVAMEVLKQFDLQDKIKVLGLVKDDKHKTKGLINKDLDFYELKPRSKLYQFLFDIQEEVHRFAIDFHRKTKSSQMISSFLDDVAGVGATRKKAIFSKFDNVEQIADAKVKDFKELKIPESIAQLIIDAAITNQKNDKN